MNIETALELATDQSTPLNNLIELVGIDDAVNRLLAKHKNSTSELLEKLLDIEDDETHANTFQNPNVSLDQVIYYGGRRFPLELLRNSSFSRLLEECPELFDEIPALLEHSECPVSYLQQAVEGSNKMHQLMVLRNSAAPSDLLEKITPAHFIQDANEKLSVLLKKQSKPEMKRYLQAYMKTSLPYCMPKFLPLDHSNPSHRFDDQVIKGFPFTSASCPWPANGSGKYLQPVAQINLENAGALLGIDLGKGLLQVWLDAFDPITRVIPPSSFSETLDDFYPEDAPWLDEGTYECIISQDADVFPHPRVQWIPTGNMFPTPQYTYSEFWNNELKLSEQSIYKLGESIHQLGIPVSMHHYFGKEFDFLRLGGYQRGSGNEADLSDWPQKVADKLSMDSYVLLYLSSSDVFCLVVTFSKSEEGNIRFSASISCDR